MTQADGEKELVLGNKQLISLFFVGVALCGVFFALGYMIGHNTSKSAATNPEAAATAVAAAATGQSQETEPPRDAASSETAATTQTLADTQPSASGAGPAAEPTRTVAAEVASTKTQAIQTQAAQIQVTQDTPVVPQAGATYLQVTALRRADADSLVKTLKEQNFPALLADSSKPDLFRVLVGPYHQTADVADAKARLKSLGFANSFVQK